MSAHRAPARRRRWLVPVLVVLLLVAAGAIAALISRQDTKAETITATSIGNVNIGDATTLGFFAGTDSVSGFDPGDTISGCVNGLLVDPITGDAPKFYAGAISGDLADDLQITVRTRTQAVTTAGSNVDCTATLTNYTTAFTGTLAAFKATHGTYATGIPWPNGNNVQVRVEVTLPAGTDPGPIAGDTATLTVAFENQ